MQLLCTCMLFVIAYMRKVKLKYQHVHLTPTLHINAVYFCVCSPHFFIGQQATWSHLHLSLVFNFTGLTLRNLKY